MKSSIWLTLLQALALDASPHQLRRGCRLRSSSSLTPTFTTSSLSGDASLTKSLFPPIIETAEASEVLVAISILTISVSRGTAQVLPPLSTQTLGANGTITSGTGNLDPHSPTIGQISHPGQESYHQLVIQTSSVQAQVPVLTISTSNGTAQILPELSTQQPQIEGTIITSLPPHHSDQPLLLTSISKPSTIISIPSSTIQPDVQPTSIALNTTNGNIFQPIDTNPPPLILGNRSDHPVPRIGIQLQSSPLSTNKFYANFFLGTQTAPTWTHPYSVAWSKGGGDTRSWGLSVSHIDAIHKVYGPDPSSIPVSYFTNPLGIQAIVLSAAELGNSTRLVTDSLTGFSVNVNLLPSPGATPAIIFPLIQGMGFITAIYKGTTPIIASGVLFRFITISTKDPKPGITKYSIMLEDGSNWLLYAYSTNRARIAFTVINRGLAQATSNFEGIIQIAKSPDRASESLYDATCGNYPTSVDITGTSHRSQGSYTLSFAKAGIRDSSLLVFALPHHIASFDNATSGKATNLKLDTTTKGTATAVLADSWTLIESLPVYMDFAPGTTSLIQAAKDTISPVALSEISQNMGQQTDLESMYFSGKALAKFAGIVYVIHDLLGNATLAQAGLVKLKTSFALFTINSQQYPLVYESAWGGVVSTASYTVPNQYADFGNTYYNDHHFHYGYFIYTAAIIGYLDPAWLVDNKAWVNTLVRDIANPSPEDNYFPFSRSFDWYHGHSWAHGLYEGFDGKDEESSSEDSMSAFAIKMWGRTIGDANMEARGNLQLAITARALQSYFLYDTDNNVEPANFIGNKVSGILFENKVDHTTFFGDNIEYIQGIHMLPLLPSSTLTRTKKFVTEEWNTYFNYGRADAVVGGWKGILYANLALIDPTAAWGFFSQSSFDVSWLDGGASLTWYLAWAAGLGATI